MRETIICRFCGEAGWPLETPPHQHGPCPVLWAEHEARLRILDAELRLVEAKIKRLWIIR